MGGLKSRVGSEGRNIMCGFGEKGYMEVNGGRCRGWGGNWRWWVSIGCWNFREGREGIGVGGFFGGMVD
jgi:hypothetical protein